MITLTYLQTSLADIKTALGPAGYEVEVTRTYLLYDTFRCADPSKVLHQAFFAGVPETPSERQAAIEILTTEGEKRIDVAVPETRHSQPVHFQCEPQRDLVAEQAASRCSLARLVSVQLSELFARPEAYPRSCELPVCCH